MTKKCLIIYNKNRDSLYFEKLISSLFENVGKDKYNFSNYKKDGIQRSNIISQFKYDITSEFNKDYDYDTRY